MDESDPLWGDGIHRANISDSQVCLSYLSSFIPREHTRATCRGTILQLPWSYWSLRFRSIRAMCFGFNAHLIVTFRHVPPCLLCCSKVILRGYNFLTGWLRKQKEQNIVLVSDDDLLFIPFSSYLIPVHLYTVLWDNAAGESSLFTLRLSNLPIWNLSIVLPILTRWHTQYTCWRCSMVCWRVNPIPWRTGLLLGSCEA